MKTEEIKVVYDRGEFTVTPDSEDSIKEQICDQYNEGQIESLRIEPDDIESFDVSDWLDFEDHQHLQGLDTLEEVMEMDMDLGVINAGIACDISLDNIEEAYQGEYRDDEEFAEEMAEQMGLITEKAQWPHYCIDWEWAAREVMTDYCEEDGYYFRIF